MTKVLLLIDSLMSRRIKYNRKRLFSKLPIGKMLPNIATLTSLFVGIMQIKFALSSQWEYVLLCLVSAAFLDATDGRLARLLNSCSRFGAELDSLSDFAVFGISPAIVMYVFGLSELDRIGWIFSVFFAICMCLRLARFNTHDIENIKTPLSGKFFTGVPAPAGAVLCVLPIIAYNAFGNEIFRSPYICSIVVVISAILLISKVPTFSIKKVHIKREYYVVFLLGVVIAGGVIFAFTWKAFLIVALMYAVSIFFSNSMAKKILSKENEQVSSNK